MVLTLEDIKVKEVAEKRCGRCRKLVPIDGFHRDNGNRDGRKYICKVCSKADGAKRYKASKAEALEKGECIRYGCHCRPHDNSKLCPDHFYMSVAQTTLKDTGLWKDLEALAEKQGYKCPLTGDRLKAGINMSLDHIKPVSRFPELRAKIFNLQWITKWANQSKTNLDLEEFVANCTKVAMRCGKVGQI